MLFRRTGSLNRVHTSTQRGDFCLKSCSAVTSSSHNGHY